MNKRYWKFLMVAAVTMLIAALFSVSVIGASARKRSFFPFFQGKSMV